MDDLHQHTEHMADFIVAHKDKLKPPRVAALGYSNGANILAAVMFRHPGLIDDAMFLHPLIPWAPERQPGLSGKRVLITAGRHDPICPAGMTQMLADYFAAQNAKTQLVWHEGGHELRPSEIYAVGQFLKE
jgi:phospholipase/carboxylesterase